MILYFSSILYALLPQCLADEILFWKILTQSFYLFLEVRPNLSCLVIGHSVFY